jgi:hypothetical protein
MLTQMLAQTPHRHSRAMVAVDMDEIHVVATQLEWPGTDRPVSQSLFRGN